MAGERVDETQSVSAELAGYAGEREEGSGGRAAAAVPCHSACHSALPAATAAASSGLAWSQHTRGIASFCRRLLTSWGELRQVVLVLGVAWLWRVWLGGILLQARHIPARRRRGCRRLTIVLAVLRLLHLRERERKGHPGWEVVVRHCGRCEARRGRSYARTSAHRTVESSVDVRTCQYHLRKVQRVRLHSAPWVVAAVLLGESCWTVITPKIKGRGGTVT